MPSSPRLASWWRLASGTARPLGLGAATRLATVLFAWWLLGVAGSVEPPPFLLHGEQPHRHHLVDLFQRWDSYWFLNIARRGYQWHGVQEQVQPLFEEERETNITPFPLYPMLMAGAGRLIGDPSIAGMLIAVLAYLAAMILLHRRLTGQEGEPLATRTLLLISIFPTAFIYNAIYSESLFLLLSLLCLTAAEDRRPWRAGLYGLGASLTRLAGGLLAPCVLLAQLAGRAAAERRRAWLEGLGAAALTSLGWLTYFLYLRHLTGSFFAYFEAQQGWHKQLIAPWTALGLLGNAALDGQLAALGDLAAAVLFVGLALASWWRLPRAQALYLTLGLLMPLCSSNPLGLPRYLMVLFPGFLLLARGCRGPLSTGALAGLFCLIQGPLLVAWLRWQYSL